MKTKSNHGASQQHLVRRRVESLCGEERRKSFRRVMKCQGCGQRKKVWALNDADESVCSASCMLKVCSRCGKSLLEKEKVNGWCCDCEGVTLTRIGKLDHEEGLL
jgi:hypothetical protein